LGKENIEDLMHLMKPLLKIHNLSKNFVGLKALSGVSFEVYAQEILGVIGPNGAGKTTLFNLLTGVYPVSSGKFFLQNTCLNGLPGFRIAAQGIGRTFQNIRLFKEMSVVENVLTAFGSRIQSSLWDSWFRTKKFRTEEKQLLEEAYALLSLFKLSEHALKRSSDLPYGLQRKLEIARAMALRPKLLLLDEPAAGLNTTESEQLLTLVKRLPQEFHCALIVIEHDMHFIDKICDRIVVLNHGVVIAQGTSSEIRKNSVVIEAYLGTVTK
jgi:branched-chain amino acid transport system ATP-binding protein